VKRLGLIDVGSIALNGGDHGKSIFYRILRDFDAIERSIGVIG
jgi:hypothetical protein